MRVGLVVTGGLDRSGRDRVIPVLLSFIAAMAKRHEVHAFVLHHEPTPAHYELAGAFIHDLGRVGSLPGLGAWRQSRRLLHAIDEIGGLDVLHGYWGLPGAVAADVARRRRIPLVVTANSGEWVSLPDIGYGLQRRWIDRHRVRTAIGAATRVTVCTEFMRAMAERHGVIATVIPMGVPMSDLLARQRDSSVRRLIHVGSIKPVKDHATLLNAFALVCRQQSDVRLDIVGADTLGGSAGELAQSLGVGDRVTFHGFLPTSSIAPLWARADVHVVSSRHDAAGVSVLEAAMAGVPTVGTRVGYVSDFDGDRAVAVETGDAAGLASAIGSLLDDERRRQALADAARRWAVAHDADWTAAQFDRLYRDITSA